MGNIPFLQKKRNIFILEKIIWTPTFLFIFLFFLHISHFPVAPVSIIPTREPVEAMNYELALGWFVFCWGQPANVWRQALFF